MSWRRILLRNMRELSTTTPSARIFVSLARSARTHERTNETSDRSDEEDMVTVHLPSLNEELTCPICLNVLRETMIVMEVRSTSLVKNVPLVCESHKYAARKTNSAVIDSVASAYKNVFVSGERSAPHVERTFRPGDRCVATRNSTPSFRKCTPTWTTLSTLKARTLRKSTKYTTSRMRSRRAFSGVLKISWRAERTFA